MKIRTSVAAVALALGAATATLAGSGPASAASTSAGAPAPLAASSCWVDGNHFMHCASLGTGNVRIQPYLSSEVVGTISASGSRTFICFRYGDLHPGGNRVWYGTYADNGRFGWTAASNVASNPDPFPGIADCN
ncbi:hypothetical protein [Kitasatospora sp. NPDC050543]|uniref:hypothetical protein n=1 Tax=Kitasatospora sp. NPDC050543 TaxID=3364054 RepID=UPI00378B81AC